MKSNIFKFCIFSYFGKDELESDFTSNYAHGWTSIGKVDETAIVVGGTYPDNKKVEKRSTNKWIELDDYPFVSSYIYKYAFANVENELYLTGKI